LKKVTEYIINRKTCIIYPHFDPYGNHYSIVKETDRKLIVEMSPINIIELSLLKYASSFQGAKEGARHLLGNTSMNPLMISEKLGLYAIPTMSPTSKQCVWFMLEQYLDRIPIGKNNLKVLFKNGFNATLNISRQRFDDKLQKALRLKKHMEDMTKHPMDYSAENEYSIVRDPESNGYVIQEDNSDEESGY